MLLCRCNVSNCSRHFHHADVQTGTDTASPTTKPLADCYNYLCEKLRSFIVPLCLFFRHWKAPATSYTSGNEPESRGWVIKTPKSPRSGHRQFHIGSRTNNFIYAIHQVPNLVDELNLCEIANPQRNPIWHDNDVEIWKEENSHTLRSTKSINGTYVATDLNIDQTSNQIAKENGNSTARLGSTTTCCTCFRRGKVRSRLAPSVLAICVGRQGRSRQRKPRRIRNDVR